jgi:hypothetical protein
MAEGPSTHERRIPKKEDISMKIDNIISKVNVVPHSRLEVRARGDKHN